MKVTIYDDDLKETVIKKSINEHGLDGLCAKIMEFNDVKIHSLKELNKFIEMLENARPCFSEGGKDKGYFKS